MEYKDMATPDFQDRKKINAKYAGIVSRPLSRLNFPEADFFEILYFDNDDNQWHCGFGSYNFSFVSAWLKSEFKPRYNRLETAITDLLARAEAAEAQIEEKEKYYAQMVDALAANDSEELKETKGKLKEVEERAEMAEKKRNEYFKHLKGRCFCCEHKSDGFNCHTKCYGHKRGSAWVYAGPEKEE